MVDLARPETYTVQNKSLIMTFELIHICAIILSFTISNLLTKSKHKFSNMDTGEFKHILNTNIEVNFAIKTFIITEQYEQDDDGTKNII